MEQLFNAGIIAWEGLCSGGGQGGKGARENGDRGVQEVREEGRRWIPRMAGTSGN